MSTLTRKKETFSYYFPLSQEIGVRGSNSEILFFFFASLSFTMTKSSGKVESIHHDKIMYDFTTLLANGTFNSICTRNSELFCLV